ncbi:amidase [Halomonas sp. BC04]|uniref:amidase n=1 Tax=Halomonas sp. BC04 TaxID=1403540 RepID=UPI0003ED6CA0|nr:amidase [Halomonas sp. BC04]EWH03426.1 hypothetical protein Q427_03470 [Halomonas sp. BC04]
MLSAHGLLDELHRGRVSSLDIVEASLERIDALDDRLKAFIAVDAEGARAAARKSDRERASGSTLGLLHGLPVAIKDVTATAGLLTTQGSRIFADNVPTQDEESVARLRKAGAIIIGKTNTPEFAFGAVCSNALRGPTCNPWDTRLTSAGSSGGSAVAVSTGMVPLAQGTDFGGSVRTPASFCGCIGLRPTPGIIPEPRRALGWSSLATQGVLARNVKDASLMVSVMAGMHPGDPTSLKPCWPTGETRKPRVAASLTLNGAFRVDDEVGDAFYHACRQAEPVFGTLHDVKPDLDGSLQAFKTLRAAESWVKFGRMVDEHENQLTESYVWNVRQGRHITAEEYLNAEMARTRTWRTFQRMFENVDILLMPAASVMPFPNSQGEVMTVGGQPCESIIDYLACTFIVSLVGFPALSIPAPRKADELPFGVQMIARPGQEAMLLHAAQLMEEAGFQHQWPHLTPS